MTLGFKGLSGNLRFSREGENWAFCVFELRLHILFLCKFSWTSFIRYHFAIIAIFNRLVLIRISLQFGDPVQNVFALFHTHLSNPVTEMHQLYFPDSYMRKAGHCAWRQHCGVAFSHKNVQAHKQHRQTVGQRDTLNTGYRCAKNQ